VIDQAITLFGVPDRLVARNYDERGVGLDEAFEMTLLYPPQEGAGGPLAVHVGASILASTPKQLRYLVKGRLGSFEKFGLDPQEPFLRAGKKVRDPGFGEEGEDAWASVSVCTDGKWSTEKRKSEKGWYPAIYESMYDAIASGDASRLAVKPEQAIWTMRLIELGNTSSREGRVIDVQKEAK
jgi:predicted dehydrogenase